MKNLVSWVRDHGWETATIALSAALIVSLVALIVVAAGDDGQAAAESSTTTTTTPAVEDTDTTLAPTTTLAGGGAVATTTTAPPIEVSGLSSMAVIVDNMPGVGYQIGIGQSELLIEVPVEGGLTRYTAIYGSEVPPLVGPVRSLRPVSADLLALFDPLLFTTGGQPFVTGMVQGAGVSIITPEASIAFQGLERPRPHHVFVSPGVEGAVANPVIAPWEWGSWVGGDPVGEIGLPFGGGVTWRFEDGVFARYVEGEQVLVQSEFDADPTGLTRETLVILVANEKSAGYFDSAGLEVPTFDIIGSGDLYVLHQGEVVQGSWSRSGQDSEYRFVTEDGELLGVPDGMVYMAIVSEGSEVTLSN